MKGYCTLCKKFENEELIWTIAGAGFFILFSTNRDREEIYMIAGVALRV